MSAHHADHIDLTRLYCMLGGREIGNPASMKHRHRDRATHPAGYFEVKAH